VAKQKRKPAKGKPITSHQLFPAVVALWFGAAFGLGSLAVRPSLLENLVLKSHLDLVVPAAAPPLGVTARILVALLLAALGATIGLVIARRIARPKPVTVERKRSGRDLGREESAPAPRYVEASTRPPVLSREALDEASDGPAGPGVLAMRRRALAIEHEEEQFVPHDLAPLPGGNPQVFDISGIDIEEPQQTTELELGTFAEPAPLASQANPVSLDWSNSEPVAASSAPAPAYGAIDSQRQAFHAEASATPLEAPAPCPVSAAAHADGRQVFGMSQPEPQPDAPRQIFGIAASDDHVPQEFVKAAGYQTTVFEQEPVEPLFVQRETVSPPVEAAPEPAPAAAAIPQTFAPGADAAPEEPMPSPASLGMTDLAVRLADSMRRRRAARTAAPAQDVAASAPAPTAFEAPVAPEPLAVPVAFEPAAEADAAPIPAAYEPPAPLAEAAAVAPETPAVPVAFEPVPEAAAVPMPAANEPAPEAIAAPQPQFAAPEAAPAAPALPRVMQPLALDAFLEEDAVTDPSLLPPRHIAMPVTPMPAPAVASVQPDVTPLAVAEEAEPAEDAVAEENYASLLEVTSARNPFVRIEEPAIAQSEIEPVVIFPGQAPAQVAPFAPVPEAAPFRRFDAPGNAGQGQPVAANLAAPAVDPGEAERALRAALSNLQRMSGAA